MKKTIFSALFLTAAISATAYAANPMMEKIDLNQDSLISKSEFITAADTRFTEADTNHDGQITKEERATARAFHRLERADKRFDKVDANGDGFISKAENEAAALARTERMQERKAEYEQMSDEEKSERKAHKKHHKGKKHKRMRKMNPDTNNDGVVDRAEHDAKVEAIFTRLDKNQDGVLSGDEMKRMGFMQGGKRGGPGR